ncbi:hypothetical protein J3R82DRAFT_4724 [Butyriboletus roseoflavus]|nr:hypothetical protein J3R82DRAFT_4724 [Butyriboletus roseoflavus]
MSFTFQWPRFSDQFHTDAIQMLNNALNKGNKPPVIADKIEVVELEMGTQPPELEIRDIGDLTMDQFRGIFRLTYAGDAHLVLKTKVQANPLNHKQPDIHLMTGSRGMLAAKEPLVVPMLLRLSHFKLNSYVVLVISKQKGITLVFKTDPLQNVDIHSTFDSIAVIQKFIQREIEGQLRQMFREDLPGIIHRLSQQWVKAKVEAPYLYKGPPPVVRRPFDTASAPDLSHMSDVSRVSVGSSARRTSKSIPSAPLIPSPTESIGSLPELENFDPTYGLRPDGLPMKSMFPSFGRLFKQNKGLADLTEEQSEVDGEEKEEEGEEEEEEKGTYSVLDWEDTSIGYSPPPSLAPDDSVTEYETIPAVGGAIQTIRCPLTPARWKHFAVRSGPPRTLNAFGVRAPPERRPVKAKRKRTYRIGGKSQPQPDPEPNGHPTRTSAPSPIPPSEFDPSEIDQYFRSWDDADGLVGEPGPSRLGQHQLRALDSPPRAPPPGSLPR